VLPDDAYEEALTSFVRDCLDTSRSNPFLDNFRPFQARVARLGMLNSLAQTLVKLTAPGMPDLYQGSELWDLTLVDPDNRRPVDYEQRRRLSADVDSKFEQDPAAIVGLLEQWEDGAVKLALTRLALAFRREKPDLFAKGDYEVLEVTGERAEHVCAFARQHSAYFAVIAVPRLVAALDSNPGWGDTRIPLPSGSDHEWWRNALTGALIDAREMDGSRSIPAAKAFEGFPVAVLMPALAG